MIALGIPIGFYGYLFPGTINIMLMQTFHNKQLKLLFQLIFLALFFEGLYCFLSIKLFSVLAQNIFLQKILNVSSILLILIIGIWMVAEKKETPNHYSNTLKRGILSIIIHPQQIPFWLVFGNLVNSLTPLYNNDFNLLLLILFNSIGVTLVFALYIVFGNEIIKRFSLKFNSITKDIGFMYVVLSIILGINFIYK